MTSRRSLVRRAPLESPRIARYTTGTPTAPPRKPQARSQTTHPLPAPPRKPPARTYTTQTSSIPPESPRVAPVPGLAARAPSGRVLASSGFPERPGPFHSHPGMDGPAHPWGWTDRRTPVGCSDQRTPGGWPDQRTPVGWPDQRTPVGWPDQRTPGGWSGQRTPAQPTTATPSPADCAPPRSLGRSCGAHPPEDGPGCSLRCAAGLRLPCPRSLRSRGPRTNNRDTSLALGSRLRAPSAV